MVKAQSPHHEWSHTLTICSDQDLNIVARVLDLLIVLDVAPPDICLTTEQRTVRLVLGRLAITPSAFGVLQRRIGQITGVRSIKASDR